MDIVSIKKYLRPGKPKPDDYVRFIQLLLQGISLHAVEVDEYKLGRFRQEIANVSDRLSDQSSAEEMLAAMSTSIRTMSEYNQLTARISQAHLREMQAMLAMTTDTIAFLGASSKTGVEQLQTVEKSLRKASSIDDVRELRGKLDECLTVVRNESNRVREEAANRIAALQESVERSADRVRSAESDRPVDPATGLYERGAAEDLIHANLARSKEFVVTLFLVDRLAHVNGRFGRKAGDEVFLQVAQHLGERLSTAPLFRWSGPALAAIVPIQTTFYAVERQMKQIASMRLEKTIEKDGRFVLLPVTCSYMLQKVSAGDTVELIARNLDKFVATRAGEAETETLGRE